MFALPTTRGRKDENSDLKKLRQYPETAPGFPRAWQTVVRPLRRQGSREEGISALGAVEGEEMSNEIDWSKAPEGATHFTPAKGVCNPFLKNDGGEWYWFNDGPDEWEKLDGTSWTWQLLGIVQRPLSEEWNGTGLPPVGTVCMVYAHNTLWGMSSTSGHKREILAYHGDFVWLGIDGAALETTRIDNVDFKPILTPEQIAAEERQKAITDIAKLLNSLWASEKEAAAFIYDAGYRKTEAGK